MDWNQISNYAARHTHRKSWGWGRLGRPASPSGTPAAVALRPGRAVRGLGPARALATLPAPPASGQPRSRLRGGFSSASGTRAALSDQRDSQRRAAVATAPEGLSDLRPRGPGCGPGAPTAPLPNSARAHCTLTQCSRLPTSPSPEGWALQRVIWLSP